MRISLGTHQRLAMDKLRSGSILCGGVGSGKSRTSIAYYFCHECNGAIDENGKISPIKKNVDLYIITTARKRDTEEWDDECALFPLDGISIVVDSWNNIQKYTEVKDAFFIFDEQRLVGSGAWVKAFLKIAKSNRWILLSATPGDTWSDYIPVFIANGFYKNRTAFVREHVVFSRFSKYPKIERYINTKPLERYRDSIVVTMPLERHTIRHYEDVFVEYDQDLMKRVVKDRWNAEKDCPIENAGEACLLMRKIVNSNPSRCDKVLDIMKSHKKVIIFYNFDYELMDLRKMCSENRIPWAEWNGHLHESLLNVDEWAYLVQYTAGAEGWNCITTDTVIFYSLNYSYKIMEQAAGRIDRMNTPYKDLYYYRLRSHSSIDQSIFKALKSKKTFNEKTFMREWDSQKNHVL